MREAKPMTPVTMRTGGMRRRVCGHISQAICMRCRRVGRLRERYTGQASIDEASWQADATETFSQTLQSYCQQLVGPVTGDAPLNPKHRQRRYYHTCMLGSKRQYVGNVESSETYRTTIWEARQMPRYQRDSCHGDDTGAAIL